MPKPQSPANTSRITAAYAICSVNAVSSPNNFPLRKISKSWSAALKPKKRNCLSKLESFRAQSNQVQKLFNQMTAASDIAPTSVKTRNLALN